VNIALVGNPNCGKTTLFNVLTGSRQRVGNWPGVTVERKSGEVLLDGQSAQVVDLPGIYSLVSCNEDAAIDERIANDYLKSGEVDVILNIIDASNLERHLYLTLHCLELGIPMVIALNMMDVAKQRRMTIDWMGLSDALGVPVVPIVAYKKEGLPTLLDTIAEQSRARVIAHSPLRYPEPIPTLIESLKGTHSELTALRALEGDCHALHAMPQACGCSAIEDDLTPDIIIADTRYQWIHALCENVVRRASSQQLTVTARLDKIILNRWAGIPIFLALMYTLFLVSINLGGVFQDSVDIATDAIFVQGVAGLLEAVHAPSWLIALLASGLGRGINTTLTFVPVIGSLFLCLAFFEDSGYMARAAFVMDRLMQSLGLPGKAFIPMIVGFGCNVPAIMAARTLENPRDRILTIMMSPFMSCSARLAIFSVFAAAFFPRGGQNIVFALYLLGIGVAIMTGFLLRRTLLPGAPVPFVMELPPYHWPTWSSLWRSAWNRLNSFIMRAGKVILPLCLILGVMNAFTLDGHLSMDTADSHSILSALGRSLTPLFAPLGITEENWPATVGLLTGTLAKEVVVGTLNTLYSQSAHVAAMVPADIPSRLLEALMTIPANLQQLPDAIFNPIAASVPEHRLNSGVYGIMVTAFATPAAAFAYCVFVLLYIPCVSTMAVIRRELSSRWMWFSILWSVALAYLLAVMSYQILTLADHPISSMSWVTAMAGVFALGLLALQRGARTC